MCYTFPSIYKATNDLKLSLNLNDYSFISLIDDINYLNGFNRRGSSDEFVRFYKDLNLLSFNLVCFKDSIITAADWVRLFTLHSDLFYFDDSTSDTAPVGVFGIDGGAIFSSGISYVSGYAPGTNKNIVLNCFTGNNSIDMKDVLIQNDNYGCFVSRAFIVCPK